MAELILEQERYHIVGAAMEVHNYLGIGLNEHVYQDALEYEFKSRGIPFEKEKHLLVTYKGEVLKHDYYADFICYDRIVIECKAVSSLLKEHEAQILNYMNIGRYPLGLLINFGEMSLKPRHFLYSKYY